MFKPGSTVWLLKVGPVAVFDGGGRGEGLDRWLGRVGEGCWRNGRVVDAWFGGGASGPGHRCQPDASLGINRICLSMVVNCSAHGHAVGNRSRCRPDRFTITAANAISCVRRVRFVTWG
jgi:hypothetical protein